MQLSDLPHQSNETALAHVPPASSGPVGSNGSYSQPISPRPPTEPFLMPCPWQKTVRRSLSSCTWRPRCRSLISARYPTGRPATLLRNIRIGKELRETKA